jgi:hypothetical protein
MHMSELVEELARYDVALKGDESVLVKLMKAVYDSMRLGFGSAAIISIIRNI